MACFVAISEQLVLYKTGLYQSQTILNWFKARLQSGERLGLTSTRLFYLGFDYLSNPVLFPHTVFLLSECLNLVGQKS